MNRHICAQKKVFNGLVGLVCVQFNKKFNSIIWNYSLIIRVAVLRITYAMGTLLSKTRQNKKINMRHYTVISTMQKWWNFFLFSDKKWSLSAIGCLAHVNLYFSCLCAVCQVHFHMSIWIIVSIQHTVFFSIFLS